MLNRFLRWLLGPEPQPPAAPAPERGIGRPSFFSTDIGTDDLTDRGAWLNALQKRAIPRTVGDSMVYSPALAADGKLHTFAEDSNNFSGSIKGAYSLNQVGIPDVQANWYGSHGFIGYQMCAILAQHWLINKACVVPARDAIRKGYKITANGGKPLTPELLDRIKRGNKRYRLDRNLVQFVKMGREFGIRIALFKVDSDDPEYYVKPFNADAVLPGTYRGISQIDPYWCVPELTSTNASDPTAIDFYEPTYWVISGKRIHRSHLVIMRGPEVADILKPSYLYGGLSVPQMIFERVYASERTANEAPQLALTKRAMVFYTDTGKALANQAKFEGRLSLWAYFRDNFGVKVADKEADQIEQHDTSLADLDAVIMTQYQLVASAANVPVTKLLGTTPKGFNSSGDYEADSYHEELESIQVNDMEPLIDRHLVCMIRSDIAPAAGVAPFDVECTWEPLDSLGAKELAEINKIKADTDNLLVTMGAIDGAEVRNRVAADEHSGHEGLPVLENEDDETAQADGEA